MTSRNHCVPAVLCLWLSHLAVYDAHMTYASTSEQVSRAAPFRPPAQKFAPLMQPWHGPTPAVKRRPLPERPECEVNVDSSKPPEAGRCLSTFGVEGLAGICQTYDRTFIGFSPLCVKHVQSSRRLL